jgi:exosortase H (IPTLxxWG-CTERM-specific)
MRVGPKSFTVTFAVYFVCGFGALLLPPVQAIDGRLSQVLVAISQSLIGLCGGSATVQGAILRAPSGFAIEMRDGCNAANVTILLCAAVIAFPAGWRMKILGAIGGSLLIQAVNIVRFITLFYLGQYSASWFDFAHGYLWESLIILDTLVIFGFWVKHASAAAKPRNATA